MIDNQDNGQSTDEKVSISLAAKALKVSTKTVHRYIERGQLSKVKEGTRVYVPMDDIRTLLSGQPRVDKSPHVHENDKVTVDRTHYDSLLVRLGQLEANQQLLLEYRAGIESRDKALEQAKGNINAQAQELDQARATINRARLELQRLMEIKQDAEQKASELADQQGELNRPRAELERARLPWWKRIWKK
jgi:DNA-binding transcriptional MerR regulator